MVVLSRRDEGYGVGATGTELACCGIGADRREG